MAIIAAVAAGGPCGVGERANQRDHREINGDDAGGRGRVGQAALEDDVHVHQAVANDGVAETQRNQHQRDAGEFHPRPRHNSEEIRHDVQQPETAAIAASVPPVIHFNCCRRTPLGARR